MCRFTFDENVNALWDLHNQRKKWRTEHVFIKVQTTLHNTKLIEINLMDTVGRVDAVKRKTTIDDFYWLPKKFSQNDAKFREETLIP